MSAMETNSPIKKEHEKVEEKFFTSENTRARFHEWE